MLVTLIKKQKLENLTLPPEVHGNYWVKDKDDDGKERNLINIEAEGNSWILKSNLDTQVFSCGKYYEKLEAKKGMFYSLFISKTNETIMIYIRDVIQNYVEYNIEKGKDYVIKNTKEASIYYDFDKNVNIDLSMSFKNNRYFIKNNNDTSDIYKNKLNIKEDILNVGDTLFIYGLEIIFMGNFILVNNPNNNVTIQDNSLKKKEKVSYPSLLVKEDIYATAVDQNDYFSALPRFRENIKDEIITIDSPPEKGEDKEMPFIYTIGPMLTMGLVSMVSLGVAINQIINHGKTITEQIPTLIISLAMVSSMLLWPSLSSSFERRYKKKLEKRRQDRYSKYLTSKEREIETICTKQRNIMINNYVTSIDIINAFTKSKEHLWEKEIKDDDFLEFRIGMGNMKPRIIVNYPEEHFALYEDNLKEILYSTINKNQVIRDVPKTINLTQKNIISILGSKAANYSFIKGLLLQAAYFNSYKDLKIVYFTEDESKTSLAFLKALPHSYNNDKSIRLYASNFDQIKNVSNYLNNILYSRMHGEEENGAIKDANYKDYKEYYIIITDNIKQSKNSNVIKTLLGANGNYGFSLIILNDTLNDVPAECENFIKLSDNTNENSKILEENKEENDLNNFKPDYCNYDLYPIFEKMMNIPLEVETAAAKLPKVYKFLEMYNCGNVKQLNVLNRWKNNDPTVSLSVPVGIDSSGELFNLDLHEKFHGPHGLVAGMTGSGKSEFLISFILSLSINFHPDDVSFVIIDYKGGGLSGAFENKVTGIKLPHLAGTITNLDTLEMNRALASIESELKRRQRVFNEAREKTGESTLDIYKYQKLYKQGVVSEPVSHLFIISDEFAELKLQQPDFMDQLISTARIGRSLGVHLILATQKPSGIVDDQIWSNSKFRVCLKVQDKSDSMDMIKTPEAATLVEAGRFYLQVGYNEYFALGQSAWCGAPYFPSEELKKEANTSVDFIDDTGMIYYSIKDEEEEQKEAQGEELTNILKYISDFAIENKIAAKKLWLDKLPEVTYIKDLETKYGFKKENFNINPIIGEYDDPSTQSQHLLTLRLSELGNTVIYGTAGSGEELLLSTILYSSIMHYAVEEVNFYIMDFGSETMNVFRNAPHVGDVITAIEKEKVINLFKTLTEMIEVRKDMLKDYNGDFKLFNLKSTTKFASIVIIINNFESFNENYPELEETIQTITRDSIKYGIYFVVTASGVNSLRYKLTQNFKQFICLRLNDEDDYTSVFGRTGKVIPSDIYGRGIIKIDKVYEFATAWPYTQVNLNGYIKNVCDLLQSKTPIKAAKIQVLPEKVLLSDILKDEYKNIPVGIDKDTLELEKIDVLKYGMYFITGEEMDLVNNFALLLPRLIHHVYRVKPLIIDADKIFEEEENIYTNNFDKVLNALINYQKDLIVVVTGMKKLLEYKELLEKINYDKIHFIIVESSENIKELNYEKTFKENASYSNALWIGPGIGSQYILKILGRAPKEEENFSYLIKNGKVRIIKLIEEGENSE